MPTHLLTRYLPLPHELIQGGLRYLQVRRELVDRHDLGGLVHMTAPDAGTGHLCSDRLMVQYMTVVRYSATLETIDWTGILSLEREVWDTGFGRRWLASTAARVHVYSVDRL